MYEFPQSLTPTIPQLAVSAVVIGVAAGFTALGAVAAGKARRPEADLIGGWGIVVAAFTLIGTAGVTTFTSLAILLAALASVAAFVAVRRDGRFGPPGAFPLLVLSLPLLIVISSMTPTQWDELTQWLPNARYLVENDAFPGTGLPDSPSAFPAYPYGLPLITFFASRVTGILVENAAGTFNVLLFLSFGLLVARLTVSAATASQKNGSAASAIDRVGMGWSACAFAGLVVTAFNPTYVSRLIFSSYADAPTAIAVGFAAVLVWLMLNALSDDDPTTARTFAWQTGLAATAAIGLKQVNLVFLIAMTMSVALIALRDPAIKWRQLLRVAPYALVLPLLVYAAWRLHVTQQISGGEFALRPVSQWFIASIPEVVGRMALVASKKGGYFGIMAIAVILALRAAWRPCTVFDRLAILTGVMFVAYNGFLLFAYVAAFGKGDALRAASFWRYNTHLGGVCLVFASFGVGILWRRYVTRPIPQAAMMGAVVLVLAMPIALAKKLRFDLHPRYLYAHSTARDIARLLNQRDRLLLVDPGDDGQYLVIMRYRMHGSAMIAGEIGAWNRPTAESIRAKAESVRASHIWVYSARPPVDAAFGIPLAPGASYLLARRKQGWTAIRQWPHPAANR